MHSLCICSAVVQKKKAQHVQTPNHAISYVSICVTLGIDECRQNGLDKCPREYDMFMCGRHLNSYYIFTLTYVVKMFYHVNKLMDGM